jgi:hypothetical protein
MKGDMRKSVDRFAGLNKTTLAVQSDGNTLRDVLNVEQEKEGGFRRRRAMRSADIGEVLGLTVDLGRTEIRDWCYFYQDGLNVNGVIAQRATMAGINYTPKLYNSISQYGYTFPSEPQTITLTKQTTGETPAFVASADAPTVDVILLGHQAYLETRLPTYDTETALTYKRDNKAYALVRSYGDSAVMDLPKTRMGRAKRFRSSELETTDVFFDGMFVYVGVGSTTKRRQLSAAAVDWGHAELLYSDPQALAQSIGNINADFDAITANNCLLPKVVDDVCVAGNRLYVAVNNGDLYPKVTNPVYPAEAAKGRIVFSVLNNYGNFTNDGLLLDGGFMPDVTSRVGKNKRLLSVDQVMFIGGDKGIDVWSIDPDPTRSALVNTYRIAMADGDDWCEYSNGVIAAGSMGVVIFNKSLTSDDYSFVRLGEELGDVLDDLKAAKLVKISYLPKEDSIYIAYTIHSATANGIYKTASSKGWKLLVGLVTPDGIRWTRSEYNGVMPNSFFEAQNKVFAFCGNGLFELTSEYGYDEYFQHAGQTRTIEASDVDFNSYLQTPFYFLGDKARLKTIQTFSLTYYGTVDIETHPNINNKAEVLDGSQTLRSDAEGIEWLRTTAEVYIGATVQSISFTLSLATANTTVYSLSMMASARGGRQPVW